MARVPLKILVVTWAWPPIGRIGAMRPLGLAREWSAAGHEVRVLTGPGDRGGEYSPDLLAAAAASGAAVVRAAAPGIPKAPALVPAERAPAAERVAPRPISRLRQILGQWKGFPDLQRSWIAPATEAGRALHREWPYDVVWTTSPPESVHFIGRNLARATGAPWVADFRDQWSEYLLARWDPASRFVIDRIAARVLGPAAALSANSNGVAASMAAATSRDVATLRNGFDPVPRSGASPQPRTLGYFGRIDPLMQRPERLWPPLRALRAAGVPWRVVFHATPGGGGGKAIEVPADLADIVQVLPPLPHAEALAKMQTMAALLVLGWEVRAGDAPIAGKLYEYVGSGRPVLVCAPAHYEMSRLVAESGTGRSAWSEPEIAAALRALEGFVPDARALGELSRRNVAARFVEIFEGVRARTN